MPIKFTKITRANMRALLSGNSLSEHGIIYERLANGDGRFVVNVMVDGVRIHRVVGKESEGVTRIQAEELIAKFRTDSREGRLKLPKGRKVSISFSDASTQYIEKLKLEDGKDILRKKRRFDLYLNPYFSKNTLANLTVSEMEQYKKHRQTQGAKNSTINRELAAVSHLFNKAIDWKWIDHAPCKIKRLKEDNARITYLTKEQIQRLLEVARSDQSIHIYPFIVVGVHTSMRRMEILSIRLSDIDIDKRCIYIPKAKAGARVQPITQTLAEFLKGYLQAARPGQVYLFESKKAVDGHLVNIEKAFRRVVENAGFDPKEVVRHTLRHTAITHLVQAGVDLPTVQRISGHKTLQMVVRYSHQNGEHIQAAMDKLEDRYQLFTPKKIPEHV